MRAHTKTFFGPLVFPTPAHSRLPLPSHRPVRCNNPASISKRGGNCIARAGALVSAVTLTALLAAAHAAVPDIPTVEGPITGPGEMQPGIRPGPGTTHLDVPLYTHTIPNSVPGLCNQTGYQTRLPELYKNYGQYVSKVEHRLKELMDEGWFPKEYASDYVQKDLKAFQEAR